MTRRRYSKKLKITPSFISDSLGRESSDGHDFSKLRGTERSDTMPMHRIKILTMNLQAIGREAVLRSAQIASRARGLRCLSRKDTLEWSADLGVTIQSGQESIFRREGPIRELDVMSCGVVRVNGSILLHTDFGNRSALVDFSRIRRHVPHAAALWSHPFRGYYHYLIEIAPKICLLQEKYGKELDGITLCYPRSHRPYELEILSLLEVPGEKIHDTSVKGGVTADKVSVVPMEGWFRPLPNLDLLRRRLLPKASSGRDGRAFLYLKRTVKRRCLNERDFLPELIKMGFTVIDDAPRSVAEQIALYRNAKVIIGPHGAAFSNMIWCKPGARIVEFMPSSLDVPYYEVLASTCDHQYEKLICFNGGRSQYGFGLDFRVSVEQVLKKAELLLST